MKCGLYGGFGDINFYKELHFAIETRLVFVQAGGGAGVFFKGFIKSGHGFEADVIGDGLYFPVLSFGIGHDLFGFFDSVDVDVIEKLSFYPVIEHLGELVVGNREFLCQGGEGNIFIPVKVFDFHQVVELFDTLADKIGGQGGAFIFYHFIVFLSFIVAVEHESDNDS